MSEFPSSRTSSPEVVYDMSNRPVMNQAEYDQMFNYNPPKEPSQLTIRGKKFLKKFYRPFTSVENFWKTIVSFIPIIGWLPKYDIKNDLTNDFIGGLTVGIMHVPQGIAYASLAGQSPVIGLYTSFFPVCTYMLFGTSRHCSVGSFAVVALMCGKAVNRLANVDLNYLGDVMNNATLTQNETFYEPEIYSPIQVASTLTFMIGICQVLIATFGMSFVTTYFSDELVTGFTVGASIHVFVTQFKDVFGVYGTPKRYGFANILLKAFDILSNMYRANLASIVLSVTVMAILIIGNRVINPRLQKEYKSAITIPFELIIVIIYTILAQLLEVETKYGVKPVGHIPTGMPSPLFPQWKLFLHLIPDAISLSVVIMAIHISLAKTLAKRFDYKIDVNQEFYALGFVSLVAGCFPTYSNSCSLARTIVNGDCGTRTQLSGVFAAAFLFILIQFSGSFLEPLPMCVLGSIIVVAVVNLAKKFGELPRLWRISKADFFIWVVAFVGTSCIDVVEGLCISIGFALFTTVIRQQLPKWHTMGNVGPTSEFGEGSRYHNLIFNDGILVFRFDAPLLFTNVCKFRKELEAVVGQRKKKSVHNDMDTPILSEDEKKKADPNEKLYLVIDCSGFTYVDNMGCNYLKDIVLEFGQKNVVVLLAATKSGFREQFAACGLHEKVPLSSFFPTIYDAVSFAKIEQEKRKINNGSGYDNFALELKESAGHAF